MNKHDCREEKIFKSLHIMLRPSLGLPERFKNKMVDKIDRGRPKDRKTAEYPAEYYRDNGRKKGRHGKADNNFRDAIKVEILRAGLPVQTICCQEHRRGEN